MAILNALLPLASWIISQYLFKQGQSVKNMDNYLRWLEFTSSAGVLSSAKRKAAEAQVERIKAQWEVKQ